MNVEREEEFICVMGNGPARTSAKRCFLNVKRQFNFRTGDPLDFAQRA